ncbi:MAG: sigma-70 family RNA polymerase sigma factor [Chloroflexi bacterium]|nr:sigma-70 family RNA polymerase sigma factor [Chloroflexota bacterium]
MEALYGRYGGQVYRMAYGMLHDPSAAEDAAQEVFITLWLRAGTYRPEKGPFQNWFLHLAHNRVIDEFRKRRRGDRLQQVSDPDKAMESLVSPNQTDEAALEAVFFEDVKEALLQLPEEQREVVVLAYLHGATQQEIADRTGVPLGTVKTRLRLAMIKLRDMLPHLAKEEV